MPIMGRTQGRQLLLTKRSKARPLLDDFGQILIPFTILFGRLWVIFWHNFAGGVLGVMTRYAKKMVSADMYGLVVVTDLV